MKILWITNVILPEANILLNEPVNPYGGWLVNASKDLAAINEVNLYVASPKSGIDEAKKLKGQSIDYYIFPWQNENSIEDTKCLSGIQKMILEINPDVVHIFGTEFSHSLAIVRTCNERSINNVVSIQGLVSVYAKHYMANLPYNVQMRYTFRDFVKRENLIKQQKKYTLRGQHEIETIKSTNNIIGRTTWDKACVYQINNEAVYHHCNESLREEFYRNEWVLENCERHSIFTSQASYPIKGLHHVLEALSSIIKRFPDTKLYIAGNNIIKANTMSAKLRMTTYSKYISEMIKKLHLEDHVIFTGVLNEKEMCDRYLKSNVFVCPSSIENSPNSLGEAMILGVPCVSSYVGGVPDMLEHNKEGFLYPSDAPYLRTILLMSIVQIILCIRLVQLRDAGERKVA
ncbi:MAG: glycosyltransferase family 4 protein [Tissierellales bacterium]|nr:glycosyltransferase family 4 protein [Tissierellales bacterium]